MGRIAYVNGRFVPHNEAQVHVEDRGYQFSDGIYEVCAVWDGKMRDVASHFDRLERSLREMQIALPRSRKAFELLFREMIRRNKLRDGLVYLQITRGVAPRDHAFPGDRTRPAVVMTAKSFDRAKFNKRAQTGVKVKTVPDERWARCDIKSVSLLPNVLAKQAAKEAGAFEAWMVDGEGNVTEGSSTTAWIVDGEGTLITRQLTNAILPGCTRQVLLEALEAEGITVAERPFQVDEARQAREAFLTSASSFVMPVVEIDGHTIGDGCPGALTTRLRTLYMASDGG